MTQKPGEAKLIGLDWGTSTLRAYLFGSDGLILRENTLPLGVMPLRQAKKSERFDADKEFRTALLAAVGSWIREWPGVALVAAGMIGSTLGWREIEYRETPFNLGKLGLHLHELKVSRGVSLHIVPGILKRSELPNVMRGEETQALGVWAKEKSSKAQAEMLVCLPGTHSKWCRIQSGRITDFETFMTGELYAVIQEHTILGRTPRSLGTLPSKAFDRGVQVAASVRGDVGLPSTLFSVRSLQLVGSLAPEHQPEYLSGLLIGHEVRGVMSWMELKGIKRSRSLPIRLSGASSLCARYLRALSICGLDHVRVVQQASSRGLWLVAVQAGLA